MHKKTTSGALLVTPVRRSARIAAKVQKGAKPVPPRSKGSEIDLEDLENLENPLDILQNTALTRDDNIGLLDGIKNLTITH